MKKTTIKINISAFMDAVDEIKSIDRLSSEKANIGRGVLDKDSDMLTIACMSNAAIQLLVGYLSQEDIDKINNFKKEKQ